MLLPELKKDQFGDLLSDKVLIVYSGDWQIARLEQFEEDCSPIWYSSCSEHWQLDSSKISHWEPLPPLPNT